MNNQPQAESQSSNQAPYPALVHLSGRRRGTTELLLGNRVAVVAAADRQVTVAAGAADKATPLAVLERRGTTYELRAEPGVEVWINGEQVDSLVLASGDVIEIGKGGAVLRFRLYPPDRGPYKTMAEAFSDCLDCARFGGNSSLDRARILVGGVPYELATQTTPLVRTSLLMVALLLVGATTALFIRSFDLERRLAGETTRVEGLAQLLNPGEQYSFTLEDFEAARAEMEGLIDDSLARLEALETRAGAPERVISAAAESIVFLQGAYGFVDPQSGKPLRLALGPAGQPVRIPGGAAMITIDGDGPEVEIVYSGSGFVVSEEGHLLTNLHVAAPWRFDQDAQRILAQGFRPVMRRFVGYLPGVEEPFEVELVEASDRADVALLKCQLSATRVLALPLAHTPPRAGDEVIVLGYPTGIRALMARAGASFAQELIDGGSVSFWDVARSLSAAGYIAPLATQGIVGQITSGAVVYDAETTHGGSGGPVLDLQGRVVAINAAMVPEFGGSNIGVPAAEGLRLLNSEAGTDSGS